MYTSGVKKGMKIRYPFPSPIYVNPSNESHRTGAQTSLGWLSAPSGLITVVDQEPSRVTDLAPRIGWAEALIPQA